MVSLEQQWNKSILSLSLNQNKEGIEGLIQTTEVFVQIFLLTYDIWSQSLIRNFYVLILGLVNSHLLVKPW